MRLVMLACAGAVALGGSAAAQTQSGHQGYPGYTPPGLGHDIRSPQPPKFPTPPKAPEFTPPPRFKPFTGEHIGTANPGLDPYPKPKKPKGGFSTYDGH